MIDYKALAERVAQRAIYADNNADPNNKAWAADLRAVVSLLNGMADAQPVAAMPAKCTERHTSAQAWIEDADQAHDLRLYVSGIMESHDQRITYAQEIARRLNAAPAAPQAEPIDPHMIAAEDRFPDVPAEQWVTCSQCDGDFDRECPICDGLGKVLATDGEQAGPKPTPASGDDLGVYKGMADSYRNDAEPTGAPYGIIDPDYGRVYTIARKLAWEEGYAIGLHGSFTRDLDLIVVPWAERACEPEHLIHRIVDATGLKLRDGVAVKPHGRRAWTLLFPAFGDPRFVDLSVMPRIGGSDAQAEPKREPLHELPPLPEPGAYAYEWRLQTGSVYRSFSARHYNGVPCDDQVLFFTADQMREYARRAVDIALERAAQECHAQKGGLSSEWGDGHDTGCDDCFAAIRALGRQ